VAANVSYASIGVDINGASFRMMSGIQLQNAQQTVIGQCVVGSCETGIRLETSSGCTIGNCRIGVDLTGRIGRPNSKGIFIDPASNMNTIGGSSSRNIISGNLTGLEIHGSGNIIQNNFIGPDVTGNHRLTNVTAAVGIRMESGSFNTIGGDTANLRNVIGEFSSGGISNGHFIKQNLIGVGIDGVTPLPNGSYGVNQTLDPYYTGGGIITFGGMPVYISSCTVMNNNGNGIVIGYTVTDGVNQKKPTFIDDCIVSKNKLDGVLVLDSPADLTRTLIFDNGGPGQLLTRSGVRPRILSWQGGPNSLFVDADFEMAAGKPFRFEIMATDNCGAGVTLGFPMLRKWIGAVSGTSDSSGAAHISAKLPTAIPDGWTPAVFVVADGNSSEAQCAECNELVEFPTAIGDTLPPGEVGQPYTLSLSLADKAVVFSASLPAGLSYQNGVISGIPQNPGENNLSFIAFNSRNTNCWDARRFTVVFNAPQAEGRLSSTGDFELTIPSQGQLPGYVLQNAANLQPPIVWQTIDPPSTNAAGKVTVPPTDTQSYYRLAPSGSVAR